MVIQVYDFCSILIHGLAAFKRYQRNPSLFIYYRNLYFKIFWTVILSFFIYRSSLTLLRSLLPCVWIHLSSQLGMSTTSTELDILCEDVLPLKSVTSSSLVALPKIQLQPSLLYQNAVSLKYHVSLKLKSLYS